MRKSQLCQKLGTEGSQLKEQLSPPKEGKNSGCFSLIRNQAGADGRGGRRHGDQTQAEAILLSAPT